MPAFALHFDPIRLHLFAIIVDTRKWFTGLNRLVRSRCNAIVRIFKRSRQRNFFIGIATFITFRCLERVVNSFMRQVHKERLISFLLFTNEIYGVISKQISQIGTVFKLFPFAIDIDFGIPIYTLSAYTFPMGEPWLWFTCIIAHVPLTKESSFIPSSL